jgi:hypothetical protein
MPCRPVPPPPMPTPPAGLTLAAPIPKPPAVDVPNPCCQLPTLPSIKIPVALPPLTVNPTFVSVLRRALAEAADFLDAQPLSCPRS